MMNDMSHLPAIDLSPVTTSIGCVVDEELTLLQKKQESLADICRKRTKFERENPQKLMIWSGKEFELSKEIKELMMQIDMLTDTESADPTEKVSDMYIKLSELKQQRSECRTKLAEHF